MPDVLDVLHGLRVGPGSAPEPVERLRERIAARRRRRLRALAGTLALGVAAAASVFILVDDEGGSTVHTVDDPTVPSTVGEERGEDRAGTLESPPAVTVRTPQTEFELKPWTYCYKAGCADGFPPEDPVDVGSTDVVTIEFPLPDWSFTAIFSPVGEDCPRRQSTVLQRNGDGAFTLEPVGHPDTYDVTLFGEGDGDLFVSFQWTTTQEGALAKPEARLALVASNDGVPDSYGVELMLSNLATTPTNATATITVRSKDGEALTFDATRAAGCLAEGTAYWDGPDEEGLAAAALGDPPFTYEVEVVLDGSRYVATALWPDDEIVGNEPSVELKFSPALPALR